MLTIILIFAVVFLIVGLYLVIPLRNGSLKSGNVEGQLLDATLVPVPEVWDERKIHLDIFRTGSNQDLLLFYVNQVIKRFVNNQQTGTAQSRLDFLRKQNDVIRVYIDNMKLRSQFGRLYWEETAATEKAKAAAERVGKEAALEKLRLDAEREDLLLRRDQAKKQRRDLTKPEEAGPKQPSEEEVRQQRKQELDARIERVEKERRKEELDPNLSPEEKVRRINALDDTLSELRAEALRYI